MVIQSVGPGPEGSSWPSALLCDLGQIINFLKLLLSSIKRGLISVLTAVVGYPDGPIRYSCSPSPTARDIDCIKMDLSC